MSDFVTKDLTLQKPAADPTKHVRYTYGMVLGEDDFTQEFAYHSGRDRWLARDLLGYGTVSGLQVIVEDDASGPRIAVKPGVALSPQGELICVSPEQCAALNAWFAQQDVAILEDRIGRNAPAGSVALYVTLCYRACPTDNVPIPGEPCRSEDNAMAASRWQDDFQLELRFEPPQQFAEDGLRQVVHWLRQVPLDAGAATSQADFLDALRSALQVDAAATPPDFVFGAPDAGLRIPTDQAAEYWRAAFRVWVTELRPQQLGQGTFVAFIRQAFKDRASEDPTPTPIDDFKAALRSAARLAQSSLQPGYLDKKPLEAVVLPATPADQAPYWQAAFEVWSEEVLSRWVTGGGVCAVPADEGCVLLAKLTVPLTADYTVDGTREVVVIDEETRPFVLHLRMLQEWALTDVHTAGAGEVTLAGDVSGPAATTQIDRLQGKALDAAAPADLQVLTFDAASDTWRPAAPPAVGVPDVTLAGDVSGPVAATQIDRLQGKALDAAAPADMQVLTFDAASDTWRPAAPPEVGVPDVTLAGDVSGPAGTTQIDRLQGKTVAAAAPGDQQVLTFDAATDTWLPATVPIVDPPAVVLAGDVVGPAGATAVIALQNVPVAAGAPVEGQVLTVVGGQWQAAPVNPPEAGGDFVEHPKALPRYAIVAAGFVRANGSSNGPVYNGLSCKTSADGVIRLVFGSANERFGYRQPDDSFQYVVKVLPMTPGELVPQVAFLGYTPEGIELLVLLNNERVPRRTLGTLFFMVEISYFER